MVFLNGNMEESDRGDGGGRKKYDRKLKSAFRTT